MERAFADGAMIDAVLAFLALELLVLILIRKNGRSVLPALPLIANAGAGAALLLALRGALLGAGWQSISLWLSAALGFHVWDLTLRWSTRRTG